VSKERENLEVIWMVDLYSVVFLGILFGVSGGKPSLRERLYGVDLAMFMLVH